MHISLCDEIGRHARLKTLSFMGPGSSPGVGILLWFLPLVFWCLNLSEILLNFFNNFVQLYLIDRQIITILVEFNVDFMW